MADTAVAGNDEGSDIDVKPSRKARPSRKRKQEDNSAAQGGVFKTPRRSTRPRQPHSLPTGFVDSQSDHFRNTTSERKDRRVTPISADKSSNMDSPNSPQRSPRQKHFSTQDALDAAFENASGTPGGQISSKEHKQIKRQARQIEELQQQLKARNKSLTTSHGDLQSIYQPELAKKDKEIESQKKIITRREGEIQRLLKEARDSKDTEVLMRLTKEAKDHKASALLSRLALTQRDKELADEKCKHKRLVKAANVVADMQSQMDELTYAVRDVTK